MLGCDMTCKTCFYSDGSFETDAVNGRTENGEESWSDDLSKTMVVCKATSEYRLVSVHVWDYKAPDIVAEPEYYKCGFGRWWDNENKKWLSLLDAEDATRS